MSQLRHTSGRPPQAHTQACFKQFLSFGKATHLSDLAPGFQSRLVIALHSREAKPGVSLSLVSPAGTHPASLRTDSVRSDRQGPGKLGHRSPIPSSSSVSVSSSSTPGKHGRHGGQGSGAINSLSISHFLSPEWQPQPHGTPGAGSLSKEREPIKQLCKKTPDQPWSLALVTRPLNSYFSQPYSLHKIES